MGFIKNYDTLATTPNRKIILQLIEAAFASIRPIPVMKQNFSLQDDLLQIMNHSYSLAQFERVFLVGFGKGSAGICKIIEGVLGDKLTAGFDIDVVEEEFSKVKFTKGTHPLPSEANITYTQQVLDGLAHVTEHDLVLVVICGGGSVMFEAPHTINLDTLTRMNKVLLDSGAKISEMNVVRKHVSLVKGGGFAQLLYPATVASLLFSDVPGNDLSVIASGPTTKDTSTLEDVQNILKEYDIESKVSLPDDAFQETPKDDKFFQNLTNILVVSNHTALVAMQEKAHELGYLAEIYSDKFEGDSRTAGKTLLEVAKPGIILLAGGETTIKITGDGKGGRNQALVLTSLRYIEGATIISSFDSDGYDYYGFAGAIADQTTIDNAHDKSLNPLNFLAADNSYEFWAQVGDGIDTGKLESNVSDLFIVWKPQA